MAFSAIRRVSRRSVSPDRMAAVISVLSRSRRVTGSAPGVGPGVRSALRRPRVLLALGFLALALHARLLVVLAAASLGEDAGLLDLLVEAAQGTLERLVLTNSDFCQSGVHLLGPRSRTPAGPSDPAPALVARRASVRPLAGPPECSPSSLACHGTDGLAAPTSSATTSSNGSATEEWPRSGKNRPTAPGIAAASQRPRPGLTRRSSSPWRMTTGVRISATRKPQ